MKGVLPGHPTATVTDVLWLLGRHERTRGVPDRARQRHRRLRQRPRGACPRAQLDAAERAHLFDPRALRAPSPPPRGAVARRRPATGHPAHPRLDDEPGRGAQRAPRLNCQRARPGAARTGVREPRAAGNGHLRSEANTSSPTAPRGTSTSFSSTSRTSKSSRGRPQRLGRASPNRAAIGVDPSVDPYAVPTTTPKRAANASTSAITGIMRTRRSVDVASSGLGGLRWRNVAIAPSRRV